MQPAIRVSISMMLAAFPSAAHSQGPNLAWKALDAKTPFYTVMTATTVQNLTVQGLENEQRSAQALWCQWTPQCRKNGKYVVVQKILGLQMDGKVDRKSPLIGTKFILSIDPKTMRVDNAKVQLPAIKKLKMKVLALLHEHYPHGGYFSPIPGVIPKSKQWTVSDTFDMGSIGKFATKHSYRYVGSNGNIHRIAIRGDMNYVPPKMPNRDLPFTIRDGNLKCTKFRGEILFDSSKGRMVKQTVTTHIQGTITVQIADKKTVVSLNQTQTVQTKVMDQNPVEVARIAVRILARANH